jgi:hypothetical protein
VGVPLLPEREAKCLYCDRPATQLCDYILGMSGHEVGEVAGAARFRCRTCKRYLRVDPVERYCACGRKKHLARVCCWMCDGGRQ